MSVPSALRYVLEGSRVLKVGVAIKNDAKLVWQDWGLKITCSRISLDIFTTPNLIKKSFRWIFVGSRDRPITVIHSLAFLRTALYQFGVNKTRVGPLDRRRGASLPLANRITTAHPVTETPGLFLNARWGHEP
jgi:hypothetical protein